VNKKTDLGNDQAEHKKMEKIMPKRRKKLGRRIDSKLKFQEGYLSKKFNNNIDCPREN
jgi:hypothetical protein